MTKKSKLLELFDITLNNFSKVVLDETIEQEIFEELNYNAKKDVDKNGNPKKDYSSLIKYGNKVFRYNYKDNVLEWISDKDDDFFKKGEVLDYIGLSLEEWLDAPNEYIYEYYQRMLDDFRYDLALENLNMCEDNKILELVKLDDDRKVIDFFKGNNLTELINKRIKLRSQDKKNNETYTYEIYAYDDGYKNYKLLDSTDWYTDSYIKNNFVPKINEIEV